MEYKVGAGNPGPKSAWLGSDPGPLCPKAVWPQAGSAPLPRAYPHLDTCQGGGDNNTISDVK